ncbi:MAG: hypothetical protein AB7R89_26135 [Dehalococcoidia bacterium]
MTTQERISKAQIVEARRALPDDAGIEEAIERNYVLYKIQRGLDQLDSRQGIDHEEALERLRFMQAVEVGFRQLDTGQSVSQEEVERRLARWLK